METGITYDKYVDLLPDAKTEVNMYIKEKEGSAQNKKIISSEEETFIVILKECLGHFDSAKRNWEEVRYYQKKEKVDWKGTSGELEAFNSQRTYKKLMQENWAKAISDLDSAYERIPKQNTPRAKKKK